MSNASSPRSTREERPRGETSEARIAKALAHPLRARILQRLGEGVASPGELAVELDASLGVVSYHVRMLREYACVELVRTEPRRGALQHFYRATAGPSLDAACWRTLPPGVGDAGAGETLRELVADLAEAGDGGQLEDPELVLWRTPLELDERAANKLARLLTRAHERALAIAAESSARAVGDDVAQRARDPALQARRARRGAESAVSGRRATLPAGGVRGG
jgi:DNA-binding transcriptional ArsR family regulator